MDKKLSNFLEKREHTVLTDIDVITAAVAVPLLEIDGEDHVVFTVRSNKLRRQPGEISFPGGHCEPNDKSSAHAAMRECSEELGIDLDQIELLGNLDCLVSAIGVKLYAVAVRLHTSDLKPNPDEVGEVFTVPLQYLLDMEPNYSVYFYPYKQYTIWGLTGRVLKNFLDIYREIYLHNNPHIN